MHHAGVVSSAFLSSISAVAQGSSASSIRAVARSIGTLKAHYDSGRCCCRKGKCREASGYFPYEDYQPTKRNIGSLFKHTSASEYLRLSQGHLQRFRRVFANVLLHNNGFRTSPCYTMFSRGIASAASIPKRQAATYSSRSSGPQSTRFVNFRDKNFPRAQDNLEELWESFYSLRNDGDIALLDAREILSFCGMIVRDLDANGVVMSNCLEWGHRLEYLLLELKRREPIRVPTTGIQLDCLAIISQALQGHCVDAALALSALLQSETNVSEYAVWVVDSFRHVLSSFLRRGSLSEVIDFYLDNHNHLKRLSVDEKTNLQSASDLDSPYFRELSGIFMSMRTPVTFLTGKKEVWDRSRTSRLGRLMIRVLSHARLAEDALEVYEVLLRQNIFVNFHVKLALVRALTKTRRYAHANLLYLSITPNSSDEAEARSYDYTGLHLFAHQGDVERAEECFERLSARGGVLQQEVTLVMHASAKRGDTKRVLELFERFFGDPTPDSAKNRIASQRPNAYHYSAVINAHAVRDDVDGMNHWLGRMFADGLTPDLATYNIVLKGVAQRDDLRSVHALLDQMHAACVLPDIATYTTIITTLARRRDVLGAEAMIKRMIREGITLDRMAVTTLMNAHVEAGSWKGVITVFDYLRDSCLTDLRLGIEVFNTLLKAYVLIGAPLEMVMKVFWRLEQSNIRPTNRTFALLIQSACDAGRMDTVSRLFVDMQNLEKDWTTDVQVTKEIHTIIMAAYLRMGNKRQARVIYDDMQSRGIQPTAYTYASILRSYSNVPFEENVVVAQEFLDSLLSQPSEDRNWVQPSSGRESSLAFVYAPLLNAHTKKLDVETVERLFSDFIDENERPTIGLLALLMDAYRRKGDIEGVQRIWPQIFELAVSRTDEVDRLLHSIDTQTEFFRSRRRGDLLCIPLSIYIDALSTAGQHIEIAHTWNKLRDAGFQFDSHNWNHLVVALVRAGQPVRAFEVVEKVIIPYQEQSFMIMRSRAEKVDSPLVFEDEKTQEEMKIEPFIVKMERSAYKRPPLLESLRRRFRGKRDTESDDLAHELQLMQQISPEWNVWRPHSVTLEVLANVLDRLDSGRLIRSTKPKPKEEDSDEVEVEEEDDIVEFQGAEEVAEEAAEAGQILQQILREYPLTIARIENWESEYASTTARKNRRFTRQARAELREIRRKDAIGS